MPVPSRIVVGCHSVMRLATSGFVDSPTAYPHTAGPKGVTHAVATLTSAMSSVRCAPGRRSATSSSHARPSTTGARKKLPWRFAQTSTRNGIAQRPAGWRRRSETRTSRIAKQAMPSNCGRSARAGAATANAPSVSERRVPRRQAASEPDQQDRSEDHADEPRPKQRQTGPATDLVDGRQDDLRSPLLVEPRQAVRREGPRVDARDRARPDDLVAGAQVVGEVDRRETGKERCQDGQRNGQERPQSVQ